MITFLLSVFLIIFLTVHLRVHPFLALLAAGLFFAAGAGIPAAEIPELVNRGFGKTMGNIGIVIIFGVIIGTFLDRTGASYKLADLLIRFIGPKRIHEAMALIGFVVAIPVFADSGFVILDPLNKSLSKKAGISLAGTATALMLGLLITHVLVPPTPGPLIAAEGLGADIGLVIVSGLGVGLFGLLVAILYVRLFARKTWIDPNPELSPEDIEAKIAAAPSAFRSFLPIVVPIVLIVSKSVVQFGEESLQLSPLLTDIIEFVGSPAIALGIGMLLAFSLPAKFDSGIFSTTGWVGKALSDSAGILLITGAGGVFGTILQESDFSDRLSDWLQGSQMGIWVPFLFAAALKTAQGSSTVALAAAAAFTAPLLEPLGLTQDIQKALAVSAIGAGSLVVSHANDSAFWVITQFSGMDVRTGYRIYSMGTLVVGLSCGILIYLVSLLL